MQAIYKNIDETDTRKLWNADVAKHLWIVYGQRCAYSNIELKEIDVSYVRIDKTKDMVPSNAAVVTRWLVSKTKKKDFTWNADQMARIHDAIEKLQSSSHT
jgi:hypothetical protein